MGQLSGEPCATLAAMVVGMSFLIIILPVVRWDARDFSVAKMLSRTGEVDNLGAERSLVLQMSLILLDYFSFNLCMIPF